MRHGLKGIAAVLLASLAQAQETRVPWTTSRFTGSPDTSPARRELRRELAKAGSTATWAMCPSPTTA